jgi:tRNA modification GTPase
LIEFAGLLELELDFSEEDVEFADRTKLLELIEQLLGRVTALTNSFRAGNAIKSGVPIAILGAPNAGKSTLLNALVGDDRAIVSDIAGTTRDVIEDTCVIDGTLFRFIDTAGIRDTSDEIESEGIKRAFAKASTAHTVLYMLDSYDEDLNSAASKISSLEIPEDINVVAVWNKNDVKSAPVGSVEGCSESISISASFGDGIDTIKKLLIESHGIKESASSLVVTNARHFEALVNAKESLEAVKNSLCVDTPSDLVAIDVRQTLHHLGSITGAVHADDILGHIFSHFCIGK